MKKQEKTLLYIAAGLAGVYLITRNQRQQQTPPILPPAQPQQNVWGALGTGLQALFGYLGTRPPRTGALGFENASERAVTDYKIPAENEETEIIKWN